MVVVRSARALCDECLDRRAIDARTRSIIGAIARYRLVILLRVQLAAVGIMQGSCCNPALSKVSPVAQMDRP